MHYKADVEADLSGRLVLQESVSGKTENYDKTDPVGKPPAAGWAQSVIPGSLEILNCNQEQEDPIVVSLNDETESEKLVKCSTSEYSHENDFRGTALDWLGHQTLLNSLDLICNDSKANHLLHSVHIKLFPANILGCNKISYLSL